MARLPKEVVGAAWAANVLMSGANPSLNEANREVSSQLYRLARDLGWHKLTQKESDLLGRGKDAPQWVDDAHYARLQEGRTKSYPHARQQGRGHSTVGEATRLAAEGTEESLESANYSWGGRDHSSEMRRWNQ